MTFFARVTSDLTRSWLLYQGLIFVLVMLFAPQGLGGLVALHARKVRAGGWKHLVAPYLLCLVVGLLLIAGLVFVVESIHVVHDGRLSRQARAPPRAHGCPTSCSGAPSSRPAARDLGHPDRAAGDRRRAPAAGTAHHRARVARRDARDRARRPSSHQSRRKPPLSSRPARERRHERCASRSLGRAGPRAQGHSGSRSARRRSSAASISP